MSSAVSVTGSTQVVRCVKSVDDKLWLACVVKRTYALVDGRLVLAPEQAPVLNEPDIALDEHERYHTLRDDTDVLAPKVATDVIVVGSAHAQGRARERMVSVAVGVDEVSHPVAAPAVQRIAYLLSRRHTGGVEADQPVVGAQGDAVAEALHHGHAVTDLAQLVRHPVDGLIGEPGVGKTGREFEQVGHGADRPVPVGGGTGLDAALPPTLPGPFRGWRWSGT